MMPRLLTALLTACLLMIVLIAWLAATTLGETP